MPALRPRPAVFLDRDGTLNVDTGYVHRRADFHWLPGAVDAVRALNRAGWWVFVVTNQSGIARGLHDEAAVRDLHDFMTGDIAAMGGRIDDIRYCPHHPHGTIALFATACSCREPAPGMLLDLMRAWPVRREGSIMIGDRDRDAAAGTAAGIASAVVPPGGLASFVQEFLTAAKTGRRPPR